MLSFTHGAVESLTSQIAAAAAIKHFNSLQGDVGRSAASFLIKVAAPFAWTKETLSTVIEASKQIPSDASINTWNMPGYAAWWHFEEPLPFKTLPESDRGVEAVLIGLLPEERFVIPTVSPVTVLDEVLSGKSWPGRFFILTWTSVPEEGFRPSFLFTWTQNRTLDEMIVEARTVHQERYGPGGQWHEYLEKGTIISEDEFQAAAEGLARFILAGMSWINSKILVATPPSSGVPRQRRKEYERRIGKQVDVKIVQLRRSLRSETATEGQSESKREYDHQWDVIGHWRNQRVGPGRGETRLTWVSPHIKGPEDKPYRPSKKVFVVSR